MTRTSIFGTERPTIGSFIKFDTPGQNETQLDEDKFEQEIINYFQKHSCLSNKRIFSIAGQIWGNGEFSDGIIAIDRAYHLMTLLPAKHPEKYLRVDKGYIKLSEN